MLGYKSMIPRRLLTHARAATAFIRNAARGLNGGLDGLKSDQAVLHPQAKDVTEGCRSDEEKVLALAKWIAENITNQKPSREGLRAAIEERRGFCGVRARMFVEMAKCLGVEARVFGLYNTGLRHTAAQVRLDGRWRFVDPMYGAVFRSPEGDLVGFADLKNDPDLAATGLDVLGGTADFSRGEEGCPLEPTDHVGKLRSLYAPANLRRARSFGFLNDEKNPIAYFPTIDAGKLVGARPLRFGGKGNVFLRNASKSVGAPLPPFLGATNRRVRHNWQLRNCSALERVFIEYRFDGPARKPIELRASVDGGKIIDGEELVIGRLEKRDRWIIEVAPTSTNLRISIDADFQGWSRSVPLGSVKIGSDRSLSEDERPITDRTIFLPPDKERLLEFLTTDSSITKLVKSGEFSQYKKRPYNWIWVFHGTAAIFGFRATRDIRFLDWILAQFLVMAKNRDCDLGRVDDLRGRQFAGWGARIKDRKAGGHVWSNEVCTAGCMVLPAVLLLVEALSDDVLRKRFSSQLEFMRDVCEAAVAEFFDEIHGAPDGTGSYVLMPHDGNPEPFAHVAPYAAALAGLYRVTGKKRYLSLAEGFAKHFRASIDIDEDGRWRWPYRPHGPGKKRTQEGELLFKARVTLIFPIHAYALGLIFDDGDMRQFAQTITGAVLRDDGNVFTTVSRANGRKLDTDLLQTYQERGRLGSLSQIAGFSPLSAFDPQISERIETILASYPELFPSGWFSTPSSVEAYAVRLAKFDVLNVQGTVDNPDPIGSKRSLHDDELGHLGLPNNG